ncbi:hypothetical protein ACFQ1S_07010, partial [Kibdelosporangium lantanae]
SSPDLTKPGWLGAGADGEPFHCGTYYPPEPRGGMPSFKQLLAALVEIPLLEKWTRDVCAFEFMEGTSDIQRQHVARAYLKGRRQ